MARPTQVDGLSGETLLEEAVRAFAAARLADARRFVLLVRNGQDADAIHDLRVSMRRLRAVLDLGGGPLRRAEREAKRLQDALGAVRDLQLQDAWLSAGGGKGRGAKGPRGVIAELVAERKKRLTGRAEKLEDALRRWADEEPELLGALAGLSLRGKLGGHRQRGRLRKRLGEVQERMRAARGSLEPGVAHALRIAVKKLRYDAELVEPALPAAAAEVLKTLVPLQETLGDLHDSDVRLAFLAAQAKKRGEDELSKGLRVRELARRGRLAHGLAAELARFRDQSLPRTLRKGFR